MSVRRLRRGWAGLVMAAVSGATLAPGQAASAQEPSARRTLESLRYERVDFEPPEPTQYDVSGVRVLLLEDHALPLVTVYARFRGGYGLFDREWYAPALALPSMMRYGGTAELTPDSVDNAIDYYAVQTGFGTGGGSIFATMNTLTEHLPEAMALWQELLARPGFDADEIEVWRARELENVRRLTDDPGSLAFSEFNRLLYGDHPVGWEMRPEDLVPERVAPDRFREMHRRIICRENLILGVTGDLAWEDARPLLQGLVDALGACEEPLPAAPEPEIRREPGVFVIERDLEQSVIVMAHPTSVNMSDDGAYYAATIGNSILGGGGFSSRLLARVRTEEGYAYGASSLWTMPRRHDGVVGAVTRTRPENAVPAVRLILSTMEELRRDPPTTAELRTAVDGVVNGFVFNFETPGQIVSRTMLYLAEDLPQDWLQRYVDGIQRIEPEDIRRVFAEHLRPDEMTILFVGDPDRMGREALASLGPVTTLAVD